MISLKLDGKEYLIPKISELSFKDFNNYIVKNKAYQLSEYLAIFTDKTVAELMNASFKGLSITSIFQSIFDIDIDKELSTKYETIMFDGNLYPVDALKIDNFGKHYFFGLMFDQYKSKKITLHELSVYVLAISLDGENDMSNVKEIYDKISELKWRDYLPQAFFLLKKQLRRNKVLINVWTPYILELKKIRWHHKLELRSLRNTEKNLLHSY